MTTKTTEKTVDAKSVQTLQGVVVSTAMKDTATVLVNRYEAHPKYKKFYNKSKRFKAHDVGNTAGLGDKVTITACRPISKDKHFMLTSIDAKGPVSEIVKADVDLNA